MDGWNSLTRYYLNNFCDGTKQASSFSLHLYYNGFQNVRMVENYRISCIWLYYIYLCSLQIRNRT